LKDGASKCVLVTNPTLHGNLFTNAVVARTLRYANDAGGRIKVLLLQTNEHTSFEATRIAATALTYFMLKGKASVWALAGNRSPEAYFTEHDLITIADTMDRKPVFIYLAGG
jgi:hypothetical protein